MGMKGFAQSARDYQELLAKYGLMSDNIVREGLNLLKE